METHKTAFINKLLTIPEIRTEYEKQRGYYTEYIGDDWDDEYFRFDKPFFYEWLGKVTVQILLKEKGVSLLQQPDNFYFDFLE